MQEAPINRRGAGALAEFGKPSRSAETGVTPLATPIVPAICTRTSGLRKDATRHFSLTPFGMCRHSADTAIQWYPCAGPSDMGEDKRTCSFFSVSSRLSLQIVDLGDGLGSPKPSSSPWRQTPPTVNRLG